MTASIGFLHELDFPLPVPIFHYTLPKYSVIVFFRLGSVMYYLKARLWLPYAALLIVHGKVAHVLWLSFAYYKRLYRLPD